INSPSDNITYDTSLNITVDLTHNNNGADISSMGNIPNGTPVNFATTLGTINSSAYTIDGKAVTALNSSFSGWANVSAAVDGQTVSETIGFLGTDNDTVYDERTLEGFNSIQDAIDSPDTQNGDIIGIIPGTYVENIIIDKKLILTPFSEGNITIQALDPSQPVITITINGSGSTIQGMNITDSTDSGINLISANDCNIINNTLTNNYIGILLQNSIGTILENNLIYNNSYIGLDVINSNNTVLTANQIDNDGSDGILLQNSLDTTIQNNIIENNGGGGVYIDTSNSTILTSSIITGNSYGIYISNSQVDINFNYITRNSICELEVLGDSTVNATDNWWGSNTPTVSNTVQSDICIVNGTVNYDPWLVLTIS
ncbi:MAG: right-handed parallel beta-helix repeat-containing protein, partial [Methanobacterium paludis]|nr:right-handed parallel beta-helix repeat-containing protein [Methanobacterium paludis]